MKPFNLLAVFFSFLILISTGPDPGHAQDSGEPLFTADLGVQTYTFRNVIPEKGVEATLNIIQEMGFTEIEGGPAGGLSPEEFRKLCEERGLNITSTGTGYEELVNHPEAVAERVKALGAKYVMTAWIPHVSGNFNIENAKQAVRDFNAAGKILSEQGITFAYHVHGYEFQPYEDGTLMDYIIQNTNPDYVSFELDIMWAHFGGADPAELLYTYGDRWKLMHIKDLKKGTEKDMTGLTDQENDVTVGTGELNIPAILKAAKEVGIEHYYIEDESSRIMTQIPKSIEYIKSLRE